MAQRWAEVASGELDTPASEDMLLLRDGLYGKGPFARLLGGG